MTLLLISLILFGLLLLNFCLIINEDKTERIPIFVGFSLILGLLTLRLFIRLPREITFDSKLLLISAFGIVILNLIIIWKFVQIFKLTDNNTTTQLNDIRNSRYQKFKEKFKIKKDALIEWAINFKDYFMYCLFTIYSYLLQLFPKYSKYYFKFCYNFTKIKNKYFMEILLICFNILPKFILLGASIIDVFIYNKFYYLYKCLWVLLIPIIFEMILFCVNHYCKSIMDQLENDQIFVLIHDAKLLNHLVLTHNFQYNILNKSNNLSIEYISMLCITCFKVQVAYEYIMSLKNKIYFKLFQICLNCGHIITWGYIFCKTIIKLYF